MESELVSSERETSCSLWIERGRRGGHEVGFAVLSPRVRESMEDQRCWSIELYEFADNAQFSNLESLLVRLTPTRCHHLEMPANQGDVRRKLANMLDVMGVVSKDWKRARFSVDDLEQDLRVVTGEETLTAYTRELEKHLAGRAAACLLRAEDLLGGDGASSVALSSGVLGQYMKLDAAAVTSLNLLPAPDDPNPEASVHGVLDHCMKRFGSRLLAQWLRQPLLDLDALRARQGLVCVLNESTERRDDIRACLKAAPDLDTIARKLELERAKLEDMYKLYIFAKNLPTLRDALQVEGEGHDTDERGATELKHFTSRVEYFLGAGRFGKYVQLVESVIDLDLAPREFRVRVCNDDSGELQQIASEIECVDESIEDERDHLENKVLRGMNAKFETHPKDLKTYGLHFRIHKKYDNEARDRLKKLKKDQYKYIAVVASGIRWRSHRLEGLSERRENLQRKFDRAQARLVKQAVAVARSFLPLVEMCIAVLAELDVLCSLAHVAAHAPTEYCLPSLSPMGEGDIVDMSFIPNNYTLRRDSSRFQIITGPNMGGKSTYIRQLGIIAVMAQIGSFVPCDKAMMPVLDAVLARVGASDAQMRGVSTFMAEMIEASAILSTATKDSLVIVDELGRGTSTYDGFGLAWAISEHLVVQCKSFCMFATHFHELTTMEQHLEGVRNRHVFAETTEDSMTMLYEVREGTCDRSFGINIAKLAGFPEDVVEEAKRKVAQLESGSGDDVQRSSKRHRVAAANPRALRIFAGEFTSLAMDCLGTPELMKRVSALVDKASKVD